MSPNPVVSWGFKAIKPFDAEHPIGSGTMVHYAPGDEVPASEWGRAEGFMVEAGSIMRYARDISQVQDPLPPTTAAVPASVPATDLDESVPVPSEAPAEHVPSVPETDEVAEEVAAEIGPEVEVPATPDSEDAPEGEVASEQTQDEPFPQNQGSGWYLLSNGEKVHGKAAALAAQADLDVAAENAS